MSKRFLLNLAFKFEISLRGYCQPPKHLLQLHPFEIPSLKEKLKSLETHDELYDRVNIGLPYETQVSLGKYKERLKVMRKNKQDLKLEEDARYLKLKIDLEKVEKDWLDTIGPENMLQLADHYNINKDLFDMAYFYPVKNMKIFYTKKLSENEEDLIPVYRGNILQANEAVSSPSVEFESEPNSLWSLLLTSLDSHINQENSEYLHWFIANIPGNNISEGELICDYMQPFPFYESGYHRMVYVLYQQTQKIDFNNEKRQQPCISLSERTFSTLEFYRKYQKLITPAGMNFFQAVWDPSLRHFFHNTLKIREPLFKIEMPPRHKAIQKTYPQHKKFDSYLESHKDPKDLAKEVILTKLASRKSPFTPPEPRPVYPNFDWLHGECESSWEKDVITKRRMGWGKYRYLYDDEAEIVT